MAYDFTTLPDRWNAGAFKYEHMKELKPNVSRDAVPLSVADMEFSDPPEVVAGLKEYLDHNVLGYTGPAEGYSVAVQNWMERRHGFRPEKDWFITSPGIVPALYEIVKALTSPGDGVLMLSPVYHPFRFSAQEQGREAIFCPRKKSTTKTGIRIIRRMVSILGMVQTFENSLRIRSFKMFSLFPERFGKPDKTFCTGRHKSFLWNTEAIG